MPDISLEQKYEIHKQFAAKLNPTYRAKNTDDMGYVAAVTRMEDKMRRIKALLMNPNQTPQVNESVVDTLLDLANYSLMTLTEYEIRELSDE